MNKKYYWLKLKEDFFEEDSISWLEEQENGKDYCLFYLKLCLKSLKTDGILIRNVGDLLIPYDIKKLSEITRTDIDTARVAMEVLKQIGLVQVLDNGEIYLTQLESMVGSETKWATYKRNQRIGQCPKNVHIEIENRDRDKEIEKDIDTTTSSCRYAELQWQRLLNGTEIRSFNEFDDLYGYKKVKEAIDISCMQNKTTCAYVKGILTKQPKRPSWLDTEIKNEVIDEKDFDLF